MATALQQEISPGPSTDGALAGIDDSADVFRRFGRSDFSAVLPTEQVASDDLRQIKQQERLRQLAEASNDLPFGLTLAAGRSNDAKRRLEAVGEPVSSMDEDNIDKFNDENSDKSDDFNDETIDDIDEFDDENTDESDDFDDETADDIDDSGEAYSAYRRRGANNDPAARVGKEVALNPANQATSKWLTTAWLNLIDSFGLTLIWINIHAFLQMFLTERLFVKLGHEWADSFGLSGGNEVGRQAAFQAGEAIAIPEKMLLTLLDIILLIIVGAIVVLILLSLDLIYGLFGWFV